MKKLSNKHIYWSLLICFLVPLLIPSTFYTHGKSSYSYGFPFNYITIYQRNSNSGWLFENFFGGNDGLGINPVIFVINVSIVYIILKFISKRVVSK